RRECLQQIGLFDERYFAYGCEMDLGLRARQSGWDIGVVWGARVENPERGVPSAVASYLQIRNALLLVHEWTGLPWAALRTLLSFTNTVYLQLRKPKRPAAFSFRGRLWAIADHWRGNHGAPPFDRLRLTRWVASLPSKRR